MTARNPITLAVSICVISLAMGSSAGAQNAQLHTEMGHSERVTSAVFSPNGRFVLTGSYDKTAILWDVSTGHEIRNFVGHSLLVMTVAVSRDGLFILTGSEDGTARLWDVSTGKEIRRLNVNSGVRSADFSPDGHLILTGSEDSTARLWETATGSLVGAFGDRTGFVRGVAFSPDGRFVLTGNADGTARLWELSSMREIRRFEGHAQAVTSVAFAPDGQRILTGSEDKTARLWDVTTGKVLLAFTGHTFQVTSVAFSRDGKLALTGSYDRTARLWDVSTGKELCRYEGYAASVESVAFSLDDHSVLTGMGDNAARLWDLSSGRVTRTFAGNSGRVESVALSADGKFLLTGSDDGKARLWDLSSGGEIRQFTDEGALRSAVFSSDSRFLLTGSDRGIARILDLATGRETQHFTSHSGGITSAAFSANDHQVLTASWGRTTILWDASSGKEVRRFQGQVPSPPFVGTSAAVSPDGRVVMSTGWDNNVHLWDAGTGAELLRFSGHTGSVSAATFSLDGRWGLTGSWDRSARLWDVSTGHELYRLDGNPFVSSVAFSPDARSVFVGYVDGTGQVWDPATGKQTGLLDGHSDWITSATFSRGGEFVVSGSFDGTTRVSKAADGTPIAVLVSAHNDAWTTSNLTGRFDTNELEGNKSLYWVVDDEPDRALPLEIFMRDYYEPRLLPRLLAGEELPKIRSLASLNRVQPLVEVEKTQWQDAANGLAEVTVKVSRNKGTFTRKGKQVEVTTGVYDLRVFRDGQLVSWAPKSSVEWQLEPPPIGANADELDLRRWREKTRVAVDADGTKHFTFEVQVPRRPDLRQVAFTAYAFNEDRVKSATASTILTVDKTLRARLGKAYLISVGVNRTENSSAWKLNYAVNDARQMSKVVGDELEGTREFSEVVRVRLISDTPGKQNAGEAAATKAHLQAVLDVLAGRRNVDEELKREIPDIANVEKAQPEDLVLLSFSSHGYTDDRGAFHIVLWDIGKDTPQDKITAELQRNSLSSDVLSGWLREVDAGEMTMIVDACHSEATVAAEGFKPGPMGSRGLGQLAYDKGMRILAASKSNEEAMELGGEIKQGLLSYALTEEALVEGKAVKDGKVLMSGWLSYAEQEVPNLYKAGKVKGPGGEESVAPNRRDIIYLGPDQVAPGYQQPVLFDFAKGKADIVLSTQ